MLNNNYNAFGRIRKIIIFSLFPLAVSDALAQGNELNPKYSNPIDSKSSSITIFDVALCQLTTRYFEISDEKNEVQNKAQLKLAANFSAHLRDKSIRNGYITESEYTKILDQKIDRNEIQKNGKKLLDQCIRKFSNAMNNDPVFSRRYILKTENPYADHLVQINSIDTKMNNYFLKSCSAASFVLIEHSDQSNFDQKKSAIIDQINPYVSGVGGILEYEAANQMKLNTYEAWHIYLHLIEEAKEKTPDENFKTLINCANEYGKIASIRFLKHVNSLVKKSREIEWEIIKHNSCQYYSKYRQTTIDDDGSLKMTFITEEQFNFSNIDEIYVMETTKLNRPGRETIVKIIAKSFPFVVMLTSSKGKVVAKQKASRISHNPLTAALSNEGKYQDRITSEIFSLTEDDARDVESYMKLIAASCRNPSLLK